VYDVSFDPVDPQRVWLLGGDPRVAALSVDGGQTFADKQIFPAQLLFIRIQVAPSDPRVIYVSGFNGTKAPLVMGVSTDGGTTWALDENASMGVATSQQIVDFLGVSPDDPQTVYVVVTSGQGDEIWKSTSKGKGLVKVLTLADQEEWPRGGFTFGADGQTIYVAGYDPLNTGLQPPASLYISRNAGMTWERRPSTMIGPRYRCLGYRAGKLYACGGDQFAGDQFFLGESTDEGHSWNAMIKLNDVKGPRECAAAKCMGTVDFLAPFRGGGDAGGSDGGRDAGVDAPVHADAPVPQPPLSKSGGCSFAGGTGGDQGALLLLLFTALAVRRKRVRGGG
jgi:MYXO-CTERM domain-containing protein